jgi:hypothetical protein
MRGGVRVKNAGGGLRGGAANENRRRGSFVVGPLVGAVFANDGDSDGRSALPRSRSIRKAMGRDEVIDDERTRSGSSEVENSEVSASSAALLSTKSVRRPKPAGESSSLLWFDRTPDLSLSLLYLSRTMIRSDNSEAVFMRL